MLNTDRLAHTREFIHPSGCDEYLFDVYLELRGRVYDLERRTLRARVRHGLLFIQDLIRRFARSVQLPSN